MVNIVLLHEGEMPTLEETYRSFQYLVKNYKVTITKINSVKFTKNKMKSADVIICVRGHSPVTYACLKKAMEYGKKILFLLDDDLKDMPKGSFWYPERKKWLLRCLGLCDGLMTSNQLIADEYKQFLKGNQIVIINTAVAPETIEKPKEVNEVVKIVVAASEWHVDNFERFVKPAFLKLEEKYGNYLEFYFVGLHPSMKEARNRQLIHYIPSMRMDDYVDYMRNHKFDLGIAVLVPDHFSERKYFNKFIEYTRYGICGIYSKCMPFELVVEDGVNGFFAENTPKSWYKAICRAIDNQDIRVKCIENAQEYLESKHNEEYLFGKMIKDCPELIHFKAPNCEMKGIERYLSVWKVRHIMFRICESVYLTFSSLSHFGIKTTLQKVKRKFNS